MPRNGQDYAKIDTDGNANGLSMHAAATNQPITNFPTYYPTS
jgi:hypothetical protein